LLLRFYNTTAQGIAFPSFKGGKDISNIHSSPIFFQFLMH